MSLRFRSKGEDDDGEIDVPITKHTMTTLEYKGFRIEVTSVGKGWRASIFEPGSNRALADSPFNLEKSRSEEIVAEAKRIIDARFALKHPDFKMLS